MNRYHPYSRTKKQLIKDIPDDEENLNLKLNLNNDVNPFNKLNNFFNFNNDTDVYMEDNHIYFKTDVNADSVDKMCGLIRKYSSFNMNLLYSLIYNLKYCRERFVCIAENHQPLELQKIHLTPYLHVFFQ